MSRKAWQEGILRARPEDRGMALLSGTSALGLRRRPADLLHVPAIMARNRPAPLLLLLHGAGGTGANMLPMVADRAERHDVLVLAPDSQGGTWDLIEPD